jgi:NSS family neurotransmitter:Na+ symporter
MTTSSAAPTRDAWSSRLAFVFAATGSAVGLGNIWKFPYVAGQNGGGAFVLVYLGCVLLLGLPLMMSELLVGRRGATGPSACFVALAREAGASRHWSIAGNLGVLASFLILSFYSVVGGWSVAYLVKALGAGFGNASPADIGALFDELLSSAATLVSWHTLFMLMVVVVVARGISRGIERTLSVIMPLMFLLLVILVGYAANTPEFGRTLEFLFSPDFSRLSAEGVLVALGQAFFSLSLGMSVMVAYASHLPRHVSIAGASFTVCILDTLCALLAGVAIFAIAFSNGLEPGAGPGLVFQTMPIAFGSITGGYVIGVMFFLLLLFAAWSSAISIMEPLVERVESLTGLRRRPATFVAAGSAWLLGIACALSFNVWSEVKPLGGRTIFDLADFVASNVLLPATGLLVAVFCGWIVARETAREELAGTEMLLSLWRVLVRYVCPVLVALVFLQSAFPALMHRALGL